MRGLEKYRWTGHKEIICSRDKIIIELEEVLRHFGQKQKQAREEYVEFLKEGIDKEENYDGGGLIRSAGGMDELMKRRLNKKEMYDERILGGGDFVEQVYAQWDQEEQIKLNNTEELLDKISRFYGKKKENILARPTKGVRAARNVYLYLGNKYLSKNLTELGRQLGIKQPAASMGLGKGMEEIDRIGGVEKILT